MRKQRYFATAGEKRKFYNNMRHFGRTRDIGLAGMALLPALLPLTLLAMIVFAVCVFFLGGPETHQAASTGLHTKHQVYTVLGMAAVTRRSIELKDEQQTIVAQYRVIVDKKYAEKRDYTPTETETMTKMDADLDKLDKDIALNIKLEAREAGAAQGRDSRAGATQAGTDQEANVKALHPVRGSKEYHETFKGFLRNGGSAIASATPEIRAALQADSDTAGGYTMASEQFSSDLIQKVDDLVFIRQLATKETVVNAQSLGIPTLDADPADADWTSELDTGGEDSTMAFGKRELFPHPLAKLIKISNKLLRMSPKVEAKVMERLAYKFAISQEKAFMTGNGAEQPLGLFTPSANGISTGRDVLTGAATGFTSPDGLFDALYTLKAQYQGKAAWILHRDAVRQIRKLKATTNEYLWQPSIQAGEPNTILGRPFYMSEYCPNTFTTGLYVGIVGDFSKYQIADALSMQVQRVVELYARQNQTGFIGRLESDGMPVLEEAFVRLKTS
jgi:HK97 family phage major capsid protein